MISIKSQYDIIGKCVILVKPVKICCSCHFYLVGYFQSSFFMAISACTSSLARFYRSPYYFLSLLILFNFLTQETRCFSIFRFRRYRATALGSKGSYFTPSECIIIRSNNFRLHDTIISFIVECTHM